MKIKDGFSLWSKTKGEKKRRELTMRLLSEVL